MTDESSPQESASVKVTSHVRAPPVQSRLIACLALALGIAATELFGSRISGSLALLSDAGHIGTDAIALGLALLAMRMSSRAHTPALSYGYHRVEVLTAFLNALLLVAIAGYILFEAYRRILAPTEVEGPIMLAVSVAGFGGNVVMILLLRPFSQGDLNVRGAWLHVWTDALGSGAVIASGIAVTLLRTIVVDVVAAAFVALLILIGAAGLVRDSVHIFLEGAPRTFAPKEVAASILEEAGVRDVHDLHVWTVTSGLHALSGHVIVDGSLTVEQAAEIVEKIRGKLRREFGITHATLQVDSSAGVIIQPTDVRPGRRLGGLRHS